MSNPQPSYGSPAPSYPSPEPVNIQPAYEPQFPIYQPPATSDLTHDDGKKVNPYSAGEDVFEAPAGFDDIPAFPMPSFPDLEPDFDEGSFESFNSKVTLFN